MGTYDSMYYDILGNLVKDDYRDLDTLKYDYRNLLRYVYMESHHYSYYHNILRFQYDEGGQRIKKLYHYFSRYFDEDCDCPTVQDSTMEGSVFGGGGMQMMMPDPPEPEPCIGEYCPYAGHSEKLYLYDGGVLLATFNGDDQVIDVHVNGPTGRLATYYHNNDSELFFFLNDHLGNARVLVDSSGQKMYYAYYPFGETIEASGSHGTEFQFTGKERDDHAGFEFDYFGARYYDARIGSFTTIDKASQFASGYVYGGNNPLIGVDPDGNFFGLLVPALYGALYAVGPSAVMSYAATGKIGGADFWKGVASGALTGGIGGGISAVAGKAANGAAYGLLSHAGASAGSAAIMGEDISLKGMVASTLGGLAAGKITGSYNAKFKNGFANMAHESAHMAAGGLISGGVSTMASNVLDGRPLGENLGRGAAYGAASGFASGLWKSALIGAPRLGPSNEVTAKRLEAGKFAFGVDSDPVYRSGGLWGLLASGGVLPRGYAGFGRDILINESDKLGYYNEYLWIHETTHFWQYESDGYANTLGELTGEQLDAHVFDPMWRSLVSRLGYIPRAPYNPYTHVGTREWEADYIYNRLMSLY